jgi:segregation and condensation protein A
MYNIKLDQFEGPLDLLLKLIEEQQLDVTRLSLAKVADGYLKYIEQKENITLENLADFLTVASKLILIKSKALLPTLELSQEEEAEIKDLELQLAEYKRFKEAAKKIGAIARSSRASFSRESFLGIGSFFYPPKNTNVFDLKKYFTHILSEIPIIEKLEEEMVREVITLEEKISHLQEYLRKKIETTFSEITNGAKDKIDVIVSFLAMLEMVKQRIVQVEQNNLFEEIKLTSKTDIAEYTD